MSNRKEKNIEETLDEKLTKTCPYCKKEIPKPAVKCMYCANWVDKKEDSFNKNITICPDCGNENPDYSKYCGNCGIELENKSVNKEGLKEERNIKCPYCENEVNSDAEFCKNCGKKLDLKEPINENHSEEDQLKICPFCESEIHYKAVKCKYCGEWIEKKKNYKDLTDPAKNTVISESIREAIMQLRNILR